MRQLSALTLIVLTILVLPAGAAAQSGNSLVAIDEALRRVELAAQTADPERTEHVRVALRLLESDAGLGGGAWLRDPLAASPPDLDRARARLAAARAALERSPDAAPDVDAARSSLVRILSNPPFQRWNPLALLPDWLLPVALAIGDLADALWRLVHWPLDRLLDLLGLLLRGPVGRVGIVVLAFLVAGGLLLLYRLGLRTAIVTQAELGAPAGQLPPTAHEALALAQHHASVGRYREACHFVLTATLLWLEEHAGADFDPAATNREHLARVANRPLVAAALAPVVNYFDRLWYGQESVAETDYRELLGLAARVREATL